MCDTVFWTLLPEYGKFFHLIIDIRIFFIADAFVPAFSDRIAKFFKRIDNGRFLTFS